MSTNKVKVMAGMALCIYFILKLASALKKKAASLFLERIEENGMTVTKNSQNAIWGG